MTLLSRQAGAYLEGPVFAESKVRKSQPFVFIRDNLVLSGISTYQIVVRILRFSGRESNL